MFYSRGFFSVFFGSLGKIACALPVDIERMLTGHATSSYRLKLNNRTTEYDGNKCTHYYWLIVSHCYDLYRYEQKKTKILNIVWCFCIEINSQRLTITKRTFVEYTNNLMYAKHINKSTRMHQLDHCFILLNKKMTTSVLSSWMHYKIKTNFNLRENVLNLMNRRSMNSYLFSKDTSLNIINVGERKKRRS